MDQRESICAIATPPGVGGVGIIRISGKTAAEIGRQVLGALPPPRTASHRRFRGPRGETLDDGIALWFPAPESFTGEDVLELQGHGGRLVQGMLIERLTALGCRAARPGEFSERAFLNNKLDLTQAEAIADLVTSGTQAAARAARRSLEGVFSSRVAALRDDLEGLRVYVESAIDFPEEEIDFLSDGGVEERLDGLRRDLAVLYSDACRGKLLRDGASVAITGRPNAGKSSVLNALAGSDRAIVTEIPGTTRDVLREEIDIAGIPVRIADTAGIRESGDPIEREGVRRARDTQQKSDLVLLVIDRATLDSDALELIETQVAALAAGQKLLLILNKIDLPPGPQASTRVAALSDGESVLGPIEVSALEGTHLDVLQRAIADALGAAEGSEGVFSARQRHLEVLRRLQRHLGEAAERLRLGQGELVAEELRLGHQALGEITGEVLPDDLLGKIFASFCIGK